MEEKRVEEISAKEKLALKRAEMEQKYADVINDLVVKYNNPNGFDLLKGIARAEVYGLEPLYKSELLTDKADLVKDYLEFLHLAEEAIEI